MREADKFLAALTEALAATAAAASGKRDAVLTARKVTATRADYRFMKNPVLTESQQW